MFEINFEFNQEQYLFCTLNENYVNQTASLLSSEWPRSMAQRDSNLRCLLSSGCDSKLNLPVSLVLIMKNKNQGQDKLIGHLKIVSICASLLDESLTENLPFIQSVIIEKNFRGKGLGKKMMLLCEDYFKEYYKQNKLQENSEIDSNKLTKYDYLYLTTKDKQKFYESLGYEKIDPILCHTVKEESKCNDIIKSLFKTMKSNNNSIKINSSQTIEPSSPAITSQQTILNCLNLKNSARTNSSQSYWFRKMIKH